MKSLDYCRQKTAPPGSSHYYALQQSSLSMSDKLTVLYALRQELSDTVTAGIDPGVAQIKLSWWRNELARNAGAISNASGAGNGGSAGNAGNAGGTTLTGVSHTEPVRDDPGIGAIEDVPAYGMSAHPVLQALNACLPHLAAQPAPLLALVDGFETDLRQSRYLDFIALKRYLDVVAGAFTVLLANTAAANDSPVDSAAWAHSLGVSLALVTIIVELGADARHGRIYLPVDEMQRFGVTAADILNRRYSPAFTHLMEFQTTRARADLIAALAAMPRAQRRAQRTLRAQAAMALRLLDEIERDGFQVLHQRIALTPVRNLLVAWWSAHRL